MKFDVCIAVRDDVDAAGLTVCLAALDGMGQSGQAGVNIYVAVSLQDGGAFERVRAECVPFGAVVVAAERRGCIWRNALASVGQGEMILFMGAPLCARADFLGKIQEAAQASDVVAFAYRFLPGDVEGELNPVTLEMPAANCGFIAVRRAVFEAVGGFDERLPLPATDVDFCWRMRAQGGVICYVPGAVAVACGVQGEAEERLNVTHIERDEYIDAQCGALLMSYKYGGADERRSARQSYRAEMAAPRHFEGVRRIMAACYLRHFAGAWALRRWRAGNKHLLLEGVSPSPLALFEQKGRGGSGLAACVQGGPMVSVVVRTCGRPEVLRGALASLVHQTYKNFEIVVVEDGPATAQSMVENEFSFLDVRYISTGHSVGRGRAGNIGLDAAVGKYLNFLDDDDYFYPDHLELMANVAVERPDVDLILGCAMAQEVLVKSEVPYSAEQVALYPMLFDRVDVFTMSQMCQIPIQSGWFKKSLYERCGGLDEELGGNEDWAMWMRFLAGGKRANPLGVDVRRATSVFVQPGDEAVKRARIEKYKAYNEAFFADETTRFNVSMADMRRYYDGMIADMRHLAAKGDLIEYLEERAKRDE